MTVHVKTNLLIIPYDKVGIQLFVILLILTEFVLKKLDHEESADNTNAKIILPLNYLTKTAKVDKCFIFIS